MLFDSFENRNERRMNSKTPFPCRRVQAGITLVGSASLLSGGGSHHVVEPFFILLGMVLIILSQVTPRDS